MRRGTKIWWLLATLALTSVALQAQGVAGAGRYFNLEFHTRGGYKVTGSDPYEDISGRFAFDHLMVGLDGKLTPKLSYKFVQRFNKEVATYPLENLSNAVDYAFLRYVPSDRMQFTLGRQALLVGGWEFEEYPIDVYDFSWYGDFITCYLTGVSSHIQLTPTQEIALQVANNRTKEPAEAFGISAARFPIIASLVWNSRFLDEKLRLRYATSYAPLAESKNLFTVGLGQKLALEKFSIYIDLLYYKSGLDYLGVLRHRGIPSESIRSTEYLSTILEAHYLISPHFELYLKAIYDLAEGEVEATAYKTRLNRQLYQVALQYHLLKGKHCYLYLNGTYQAFGDPFVDTSLALTQQPDQFRLALGLVARLSLLRFDW